MAKLTSSLVYALILYIFIFIIAIINFIYPAIYHGLFFYFIELSLPITTLMLLPLILFSLYWFGYEISFIKRHEMAMRFIIIISVVVSLAVTFMFAILV